jgi:HTH-type transcriptional regulator / antitoxin HigA
MNDFTLAEVFPPGEFIKDALEARGWTQLDLAEITGRAHRHVNEVINGKTGITPRTAKELAAAFDTTPEFWLNLENQFQLSRTTADDAAVSRKARLYRLPIRAMTKRGWIQKTDDLNELEGQVTKFFGVDSLEEIENFRHAAKKSSGGSLSDVQLAWLYRVRQVAKSFPVSEYSESKLKRAIERLEQLRAEVKEIRHIPRLLSEAGLRFVLVEAPEASKIDGVCFWLRPEMPVVGMSLRFDRIDNFWFVLRHELEHVLHRHGLDQEVVDIDLEGDNADPLGADVSVEEKIANAAGAEFCVPGQKLKSFVARKQPYISERDIVAFAKLCGVHPGLVVGQLHRSLGEYRNFRAHLVPVSKEILSIAVVDGWGQTAPV